MAIKLEAKNNYIVLTNTITLETVEYPKARVRYKDYSNNIQFKYIDDTSQDKTYQFSELVDENEVAWTDLATLLTWLRKNTGGEAATSEIGAIQIVPESEFNLEVSKGNITGYSVVDKFGFNSVITTSTDPEDVWEGGGIYTYDANNTAPIVSLASNNGADNQDIDVQGLDVNGNLVNQTITLNGTTRVALTTSLWRVFRMQNESSTSLQGTVFCYTGVGTVPSIGDSEVRAIIDDGNNQTQMALYTIPLGYVGFLYYGELAMEQEGTPSSSNEFANCAYNSRRYGKIFKVKKTIPLNSQGTSTYQDRRRFPDVIPALTDIKLTINEVSATMGISGSFDILLVEESQLSSTFLTAIGQPSNT